MKYVNCTKNFICSVSICLKLFQYQGKNNQVLQRVPEKHPDPEAQAKIG